MLLWPIQVSHRGKERKMKVVLIYPPNAMHKVSYNLRTTKYRAYGHQPPLGLGYVAAIAEKAGHQVSILDAVANDYSVEQCAALVRDLAADLVGISTMTHMKEESYALSGAIKKLLPQIPIVLGGTHAYYFHSEILKESLSVDFVLYGEIENSWPLFLANVKNNSVFHSIKGLCFRENGEVVINEPAEIIDDLDQLPMPSWHLYDLDLYRPLPLQAKGKKFFALITSRGCAYGKCIFCYQSGRKKQPYRRHSPERVVAEMKFLHEEYGINDIVFWDDTFSMDMNWLDGFKKNIEKTSLDMKWTCSTKVSYLNKEKLALIKETGCWSIFLGIESGDEDLLKVIDKGITLDQARRAVKWANEVGIETRCAFMLGLPGEGPLKAKKTIDFAKEIDPTYSIFYATHPRFGTKLYDIAWQAGNFLSEQFKGMTGITYVPFGYKDAVELRKYIRKAYTDFYCRPRQIIKYLKKIRSFSDIREIIFALELFFGLRG